MRHSRYVISFLLLTCALGCSNNGNTSESTLLRWIYHPGQKYHVSLTKTNESDAFSGSRHIKDKCWTIIDMIWSITAVDESNTALIDAKVERARLNSESPEGNIAIDTASAEDKYPEHIASQVKALKDILPTLQWQFTINNRGCVLSVKENQNAANKIESLLPEVSGRLSAEMMRHTFQQILPILPESSVKVGDTWKDVVMLNRYKGDALQKVNVTFCYAGHTRHDDADVDKITTEAFYDMNDELSDVQAAHDLPVRIARHENSGTALFDNKAGRLLECEYLENLILQIGPREKVTWKMIQEISRIEFRTEK